MSRTLDLIRPIAEEKSLTLTFERCDAPVILDTDPGKLRQILLNVIANAVNHRRR